MLIYILNLVFTTTLAMFVKESKRLDGNFDSAQKVMSYSISIIILILFSSIYSFRWYVGTDFGNYYYTYTTTKNFDLSEFIGDRDWGFSLLAPISNQIFPDSFIFYNFILATLTYAPVILNLRKNSLNFPLSILLYITTMSYYFGFNGVRQGIAISITFASYMFLLKKQYVKYILTIFIASLFHITALIFIPLIYFITKKTLSRSTLSLVIILITITIFLPNLWGNFINFLESIGQIKLANDYREFNNKDDGIHFLRVVVPLIPLMIGIFNYQKLKAKFPELDIVLNLNIIAVLFLLLGTQMTVLARLSTYFSIYIIILIPYLTYLYKGFERIIFIYITTVMFVIYMLLLLPVDSELVPYKWLTK